MLSVPQSHVSCVPPAPPLRVSRGSSQGRSPRRAVRTTDVGVGGTGRWASGRASWRGQHRASRLSTFRQCLPSHQLRPRGAGTLAEEALCVAWWSPARSGRVRQATQEGAPTPSNRPWPQAQARSPRLGARGPGLQFPSSHRLSFPSVPTLAQGFRQAPPMCLLQVRPQVAFGDLEMDLGPAWQGLTAQLGTQTWTRQ